MTTPAEHRDLQLGVRLAEGAENAAIRDVMMGVAPACRLLADVPFERELIEQRSLFDLPMPLMIQSSRTD